MSVDIDLPAARFCSECANAASVCVTVAGVFPPGPPRAVNLMALDTRPLVQVDRHAAEYNQEGIGLGLASSRDLARQMHGELVAASTLGKGSTFTLTLPAA